MPESLSADVFSQDPQRRAVELALLHRCVEAAETQGAAVLASANEAPSGHLEFERDLARMQSPVFRWLARALEKTVAHDVGFGRFQAGRGTRETGK